MGLAVWADGKDVLLAAIFLGLGFLCPPLWIVNGVWLLSEYKMAKRLSFIALTLWSVLSLGTVLAIMIYVMIFVPAFNLVPQADPDYFTKYGPDSNVTSIPLF